MKRKLILLIGVVLMGINALGASIDEGEATPLDVKAVGTVLTSLSLEDATTDPTSEGGGNFGGEGLDMGIMMSGAIDSGDPYRTIDNDRSGDPHPAVVKVTGGYDSTSGGAIVNFQIRDTTSSGTENAVTIFNTDGTTTSSIVVALDYSLNTETAYTNRLTSLNAITLDADGEKSIFIHGEVNSTDNTGGIPNQTGLYEGTINVQVNYDDSTSWF